MLHEQILLPQSPSLRPPSPLCSHSSPPRTRLPAENRSRSPRPASESPRFSPSPRDAPGPPCSGFPRESPPRDARRPPETPRCRIPRRSARPVPRGSRGFRRPGEWGTGRGRRGARGRETGKPGEREKRRSGGSERGVGNWRKAAAAAPPSSQKRAEFRQSAAPKARAVR